MPGLSVVAAMLALPLLLGSCASLEEAELTGTWQLVSMTTPDETIPVVVGVNAASQPWISMQDDPAEVFGVFGNAGCNDFQVAEDPAFTLSFGRLRFGEVTQSAVSCGTPGAAGDDDPDPLMSVEDRFLAAMRDPIGVAPRVGDGTMLWDWGPGRTLFEFVAIPDR